MTTKDLGMVTAYAYAVMGGYEGTEAEFEALLGNIATDLEEIENLTVVANTLPEGSSATASYADGVLTLGIPKGDTGATGAGATATVGTTTTGNPGTNASVTNSGTAKDAVFNFTIPRGATGNGIESIYLTGTSGAVKTYTILFTDGNTTTFDVTDGEVTNASLATILEDYAKTDGAYESMTVGNAEQLISSVTVNDKVPYNFRTSGGSIDIGNREVDKLVGGTVAWNQKVVHGDFDSTTGWYKGVGVDSWSASSNVLTINISGGSVLDPYKYGIFKNINGGLDGTHKYLSVYGIKPSVATTFRLELGGNVKKETAALSADVWSEVSFVNTPSAHNSQIYVYPYSAVVNVSSPEMTIQYRNVQLFDLTAMFGSTIADYIYSLEQATAGAGVAWFKKLFPKDYYAYNAGQLMSVKTSAHQMVGFNAWDEVTELGYISNSTGRNVASTTQIRGKNYIHVIPNTTYYFKSPTGLFVYFYDANKEYIGVHGSGARITNNTITLGADVHYIRISMASGYGTTYNHDICINLHWDGERDGEYEPYEKHSYPLDNSLTLRGIPKLDNGNLYYDGDEYASDGSVVRKYGVLEITSGMVALAANTYSNIVYARIAKPTDSADRDKATTKCIHDTFMPNTATDGWDDASRVKQLFGGADYNNYWFGFASGTTLAQAQAALTGTKLVYELATPTTETADPYQNPQIVDDFGTEEYVDERTVVIPVGHDTEYMNNLKAKLEMAPDSPDGDGDYIVRQTNGENSYVPLMKELPSLPSTDGTYTLKCTVASGVATLGWVEEE